MKKVDFWDVLTPNFNYAMIPKNILCGFRKTGIYPYHSSAISIQSLMPIKVTEKGDVENTLNPFILEMDVCEIYLAKVTEGCYSLEGFQCFPKQDKNISGI